MNVTIDSNTSADWRLTPAAPAGAQWTSRSTPGTLATVVSSSWNSDGDGVWIVAANWQNEVVPGGPGSIAVLGDMITAPRTIALIEDQTVGTLRIDAASSYTIDGPSQLIMNAGTSVASIQVARGSHTVLAPMTLTGQTVFDVATGANLDVQSDIASPNLNIGKSGGGTLKVNRIRAGALSVAGGTLAVRGTRADASTSVTTSLSIATGATLDLGDNALVLNYAAAATTSPLAAVTAAVKDGRLTSSKIAADSRLTIATADTATFTSYTSFGGVELDATAIIARVAIKGDTNIDGDVDFDDLVVVAQNYNTLSGATWTKGDITHDGIVDFDDLVPLAQNYNANEAGTLVGVSDTFVADWALAQSLVPEPTFGLALVALALPTRRRR